MLKVSSLTSILRAYGKVITIKHETILKINLLKNNIIENNIIFVICCIVKLQGQEGIIKTQICYTAGCSLSPVCPIAICSSFLMPACF